MSKTTSEWEALLKGATSGPWETFHDEWEEEDSDGRILEYGQFGVIGGDDGILDTGPHPSIMNAPNQWAETGEHNNLANTLLAAAAPAAVAEVVRLRRAFTEWADQLDTLMDEMDEKGHTLNADQISAVTAGIRFILEGGNE